MQCNSCGSFDDIQYCPHCIHTPVCARCKANHEMVCSEMQKRKMRGEGPTIRANVPQPIRVTSQLQDVDQLVTAVPADPIEAGLQAVKNLLSEN